MSFRFSWNNYWVVLLNCGCKSNKKGVLKGLDLVGSHHLALSFFLPLLFQIATAPSLFLCDRADPRPLSFILYTYWTYHLVKPLKSNLSPYHICIFFTYNLKLLHQLRPYSNSVICHGKGNHCWIISLLVLLTPVILKSLLDSS